MSDFEGSVSRWQTPDLGGNSNSKNQEIKQEEAAAKARREGFEEGRRQVLEQKQSEIDGLKQRLEALLQAFEQPLGGMDSQMVGELSQLAVKIAELILHSEIEMNPALVERLAEEALKSVDQSESASVRMHPEDLAFLKSFGLLGRWQKVSFSSDPELSRGSVMIRVNESRVDASVEARLRQVLHDLLGED